jgi:hypothetical protein
VGRSRRSRRRYERARAKRPSQVRRVSAPARIGFIILGLVLVAAGIFLLADVSSGTAARLGRVAGILMIVGCVLVGVGAVGKI